MSKPVPKPSMLDQFEFLGFINGDRRWRSDGGMRLYTWDSLHGEIEVFNNRGKHLGSMDPSTGIMTKPAIRGRKIDV
jgi:Cytotoxic